MKQYLDLLRHVIEHGRYKSDRTGTGTASVFGYQMRFDLKEGFPLLTTKKLHLKSIIHELLWMLSGSTNVKYLQDQGVRIWNEWADERGDLGPVYGHQWRSWPGPISMFRADQYPPSGKQVVGYHVDAHNAGVVAVQTYVDQISTLVCQIKANPDSRRLIVTAWNPADVGKMALPPCHCFFQFNTRVMTWQERHRWIERQPDIVAPKFESLSDYIAWMDSDMKGNIPSRYLDCQLYQRSGDVFLGVPFNIASYALLTSMVAQVCNIVPGDFVHTLGDAHIYSNHMEQVQEQLEREPRALPTLRFNRDATSIFNFKYEDISVDGYDPHPSIAGEVAV